MTVCPACGRTFDELRHQVVVDGIDGPFDSFDCAESAQRRQLSRRRLVAAVGEAEAARLLADDLVPAQRHEDPPQAPPSVAPADV